MKEDRNDSNKLDNIEKKDVFSAPDGYFQELQSNVFDKIESLEKQVEEKHAPKHFFFNPFWMSVAAAITVLLITFFSIRNSEDKVSNSNYYALIGEVSSDEIIAYLEQSDISIAEIQEVVKWEDLEDPPFSASEAFDNYTEEELDDLYEYYSL